MSVIHMVKHRLVTYHLNIHIGLLMFECGTSFVEASSPENTLRGRNYDCGKAYQYVSNLKTYILACIIHL